MSTTTEPSDYLDWSRERDGRMADYATADDFVPTLTVEEDASRAKPMLALAAGRQHRLPSHLRSRGLQVEVVAGYELRGSSTFNPRGVLDHWTAGPRSGDRPSLHICIYGRRDLPGPLCHVFLTRAGVCVVVAAGRANHAGAGGWKGLAGNASMFGVEAESSGWGDWTDAQRAAYPLLSAALAELAGCSWEFVGGHNEWAPRRKSDIEDWRMPDMRNQAAAVWRLDRASIADLQRAVGASADGIWGPQTLRAAQAWLGRPQTNTWGGGDARALQGRVGATVDGVLGAGSIRALRAYLSTNEAQPQEEDIMATKAELREVVREVVREELSGLLGTPLLVSAEDWNRPAQGGTVRDSMIASLHNRDVPDGGGRLDEAVRRLEGKVDKLLNGLVTVEPELVEGESR